MKTIAFDTSTMTVAVGVLEEDVLLSEFQLQGHIRHSESMLDMVEEMMKHLNLKVNEMDLVAVGTGAGSFTGLRIAVTTAKILGQVLGIPVKGVSSLEALVEQWDGEGIVIPVLDARRHRLYRGIYEKKAGTVICHKKDDAVDISSIIEEAKEYGKVVFIGDGLDVAREELKESLPESIFVSPNNGKIRGTSVGILAQRKFQEEGSDNLYELEPNYVRPSQAMREYRRKHGEDA